VCASFLAQNTKDAWEVSIQGKRRILEGHSR